MEKSHLEEPGASDTLREEGDTSLHVPAAVSSLILREESFENNIPLPRAPAGKKKNQIFHPRFGFTRPRH